MKKKQKEDKDFIDPGLGERLAKVEVNIEGLIRDIMDIKTNHLNAIYSQLKEFSKTFQSRVPVWVMLTISFLTSACTGLLILYLSTIGRL